MRLENKVALVTGASAGMGNSIGKLFAKEGASVVLIARRKEKLEELVNEIKNDGGKAIAVAGDVTNEEDVQNAVKTAVDEFGKLDIVINNAGMLDKMDPVADMSDDVWDSVINVNLTGPMRIFRSAIPEMEKNGGGSFVTIASVSGLFAGRGGPAYTASKHGVLGLAKNVAFMYAKKNIRSNVIAPGTIATEMVANVEKTCNTEGYGICISGTTNIPRIGKPEEVARIALFLASDDSDIINGAVVTADAGWTSY
ncbi:MAG TPA: 3-ketoacyl-ACP reductase [Clostridiaceae bacterium]|nr:3-ketoacyl-ACP reductase [Porphyromonadaceae bacterium]HBX49125.1 3-ketoacyl-ACP reductase [Clostridiaceae bacterium]